MFRALSKAALIIIVGAGAVGCQGDARFVHKDATGGVVAIPANSVLRPYYRDEAIRMIREQHNPNFAETDIVSEQEVSVGSETRNEQRTDRIGDDKKKPDTVVRTDVTTTSPVKEYWIEYKIGAKQPQVNRPTTGGQTVKPVTHLEKSMPAPVPNDSSVFPAGGIPRPAPTPSMHQTGMPQTGMPMNTPYGGR